MRRSTGHQDKNGTCVYEGDILLTELWAINPFKYSDEDLHCVVFWDGEDWAVWDTQTHEGYDFEDFYSLVSSSEVVGNMEDNADMITVHAPPPTLEQVKEWQKEDPRWKIADQPDGSQFIYYEMFNSADLDIKKAPPPERQRG